MSEKEAIVLVLIAVGAYIVPFTSKKLMLPSAVGEILYGMGLAFIITTGHETMPLVKYFSMFGFLLLMYIAGLELDFNKFRDISKKDVILYFSIYIPILLASIFIVNMFNLDKAFVLVLFTTGIGLQFSVLKETGLMSSSLGQSMLIICMIGEIFSLLGLTLFSMIAESGVSTALLFDVFYIAIFFVVIYIVLKGLKYLIWWFPELQAMFLKVGNITETGIRANFLILFFFVALAVILKIEFVIGAFIGGMIIALVFPDRESILERLTGVAYGFFIPVFFISVGAGFNYKHIFDKDVLILALILSVFIFITKFIGSILLFFTDIKNRKVILVATSLSFPLTIVVAIGEVFKEKNIITEEQSSAILLSAIITAIIYPWVFKLLVKLLVDSKDVEAVE